MARSSKDQLADLELRLKEVYEKLSGLDRDLAGVNFDIGEQKSDLDELLAAEEKNVVKKDTADIDECSGSDASDGEEVDVHSLQELPLPVILKKERQLMRQIFDVEMQLEREKIMASARALPQNPSPQPNAPARSDSSFPTPPAGQDLAGLQEHWAAFQYARSLLPASPFAPPNPLFLNLLRQQQQQQQQQQQSPSTTPAAPASDSAQPAGSPLLSASAAAPADAANALPPPMPHPPMPHPMLGMPGVPSFPGMGGWAPLPFGGLPPPGGFDPSVAFPPPHVLMQLQAVAASQQMQQQQQQQ